MFDSHIEEVKSLYLHICFTFLGKRKPWSGILLYGVRHLCLQSLFIVSAAAAVVVLNPKLHVSCMIDL